MEHDILNTKEAEKSQLANKLIVVAGICIIMTVVIIIMRIPIVVGIYKVVGQSAYNSPQSNWYSVFTSSIFQNVIANTYRGIEAENYYKITKQSRTEYAQNALKEITSDILPEGYSSIVEGVSPSTEFEDTVITHVMNSSEESKVAHTKKIKSNPGIDSLRITGTATTESILQKISNEYRNLIEANIQSDLLEFADISTLQTLQQKQNVTEVYNVIFAPSDVRKNQVGEIHIVYKPCNIYIVLPLEVNSNLKYRIVDSKEIVKHYCDNPLDLNAANSIAELATCTDCTLYPISKNQKLRADYIPEVAPLTAIGSTYSIDTRVINDLTNMFVAATSAGHNMQVTSAYRSYQDQVETFKYWVEREMYLYGLDKATAEINANRYSARPGFSEHQLGTVVDLNSKDCDAFDGYCYANESLWMWLNQHAYEYGFVLSYPQGKELLTGYVSEPWHYRWIGVDMAKQYKAVETSYVLVEWLRSIQQ